MRRVARLVVSYAAFALIATGVNIGSQWIWLKLYVGPLALTMAMVIGTGTGLIIKYVLDKRWIFNDKSNDLRNHSRKFTKYAVMGLGTTAIFWATEFAFNAMTADGHLRFLGAAIGLGAGYMMKYWLDRRFVFEGDA
jgi:putative flippase GtrA